LRDWLVSVGLLPVNYRAVWPKYQLVDIRKRLPLGDRSVEWVYCSHVLEHLEYWQAIGVLREVNRVLKKGGRVRVVLPDLAKMLEKYQTDGDADVFNRDFFGFEKDKKTSLVGTILRRFIRPHQWIYDKKTAENLLKSAGFEKVEFSEYRKSKMPDVDRLDVNEHKTLSVYLEAEV